MKKIIFIILLAFLIIPVALINTNVAKGSEIDAEMERYIDSTDRIIEIVSNSIITLPKLNMLGTDVIASLVAKVNKYSTFVNDYTQDIEVEGRALFNDLMEGYRVIRKTVFLAKSINTLITSQQVAYELINTIDNYLDVEISVGSDYGTFKDSLSEQRYILDDNFESIENLTLNIISNINMESDSYSDDINNLLSLRSRLKEITDTYLNVSNEIINISEEIIVTKDGGISSDHGSDHGINQ